MASLTTNSASCVFEYVDDNDADLSVGFPHSVKYNMLMFLFAHLFQILARCKADKGNARLYKYPRSFESNKVRNWFSFLLHLLCRASEMWAGGVICPRASGSKGSHN